MFADALSDLIVEIFRINGRLLVAGDRLVAATLDDGVLVGPKIKPVENDSAAGASAKP